MSDEMILTFVGIGSGDCESACYDVSLEEFVRLTGEKPARSDRSKFYGGMYRFYPPDLAKIGEVCEVSIACKPTGYRMINHGASEPPVKSWDETKEQPDED
jgi:hypothetical protein